MSAPDPILRRVWASLVTALEGIVSGSDYHSTVRFVSTDLVNLLSLSSQQTPAFLVMADGEGAQRLFHMAGQVKETFSFVLEGRLDAPGLLVSAKADAYARMLLDVEYALTRDVTRGGIASATFIRSPKGPFMGLDTTGIVQWQQRVDVIVVRDTGER
ncbi:MAG: hypothetical protein IPO08_21515 [Xanthomonadales bacterium]|nr:hypothetical protein [Xanthomonadales bacterium]